MMTQMFLMIIAIQLVLEKFLAGIAQEETNSHLQLAKLNVETE